MAQTLTLLYVHIVFSTKDRTPWIDPTIEPDLIAYVGGIARNLRSPVIAAGVADDHVHLLLSHSKTIALADLVMHLKKDSSNWIKTQRPDLQHLTWQDGYAGFSVSPPAVPALETYFAKQREHHAKLDFKAELRKLCRQYGVELDESVAWT